MNDKVVSGHLQDSFVFLCIVDLNFLKIARMAISPNYFSSQVTEDIIRLCYTYYDQFKEAPPHHLYDELVRFLHGADDDKRKLYFTYLDRIKKEFEKSPPKKPYVLSRFNKFIQAKELEASLKQAAPLVDRGKFDEAKAVLHKALRSGITSEEEGIEYPGEGEPTYYSKDALGELLCSTGIRIIDNGIKGLRRTQLVCIFAGYKVGKTWGCAQIARQALTRGLKVCEISHEISAAELEMRHDMMFGGLTNEEGEEPVEFFEYDNTGRVTGSHEEVKDTIFNPRAIVEVRNTVRGFGGQAILKKYPMGTCTIGEIERYLDYLETFKHFIPDVLISDYVEKMKLPAAGEGRDRINEAYINLKRIADERNIVVVTASQIKTASLEKSNISEAEAPAEDARKLGNIDLGLFYGMNKVQARRGLMQAFVLVNRSGPQKFGCVVSRNLKVGQMCLECWPLRFEDDEE